MVLGSKKAKGNAKHGKVLMKQKNKKATSPDLVADTEPTDIIQINEAQTPAGSPTSANLELVEAEAEPIRVSEPSVQLPDPAHEQVISVNDFLEVDAPSVSPTPSSACLVTPQNEEEREGSQAPKQASEPVYEEHHVQDQLEGRHHPKDSPDQRYEEHPEYRPSGRSSQSSTRRSTPKPSPETPKGQPTYEEAYAQYPGYPGYSAYPAYPTEYPERAQVSSPFAPYPSPPALVPLPSPSLTEARFMSSASPEAHYYPYYPPPPLPYSPYATPHYSAPYYHSPVPKVSSPLARSHYSYASPVMSPTATPPPPAAQPATGSATAPMPPPSTTHSYASATQSPVMSSAGVVPPYNPYTPPQHQPHDSHYMQRSYSGSSQPYAASFQAIQNLGLGNGQINENGVISPPENDQEHVELLQRIQSAIPDINRLLHGFRHTHTRLNSREAEIKQIGNQHEQALMHKDFYIEALQSQMKKTANESAEECAKLKNIINELRLEVGDLQEKQKDLEDGLADHQKTNEELSKIKTDLEAEVERLTTEMKAAAETHATEMERQKEDHSKAILTQKQELTELFEEIKGEDEKAALETLEVREKELRDQLEAAKADWSKEKKELEDDLEAQRGQVEAVKSEVASKTAVIESKESELKKQAAELDAVREEAVSRVAELEAKNRELEDLRKEHAEACEELRKVHSGEQDALRASHAAEAADLRQSHEEQLAAAAKELQEKIADLEAHFQEQEKHWEAERAALQKLLNEKGEELSSAEREKDKLEGDGLMKEQQLQRAVEQMRSTIDNLDHDCDRLRRTLQSLGEATDLKTTKGDQFFVDCFAQLATLIADLSNEYFVYLPIDPPKDILSKIPSELPSFLDNSPPSRALRAAYVQHVVSKTLTYRVFQPFLFTLGRRYDKADTFFQMLSSDIRRKSVRREAFWRQQTLKAAYTTSDAKQSINVAAAVIVDEIIDQIRHFADPRQLDSLLTAVRKIVKLAAETWRHARVERELVIAHFPAPGDEMVESDGWVEYTSKDEVGTSEKSLSKPEGRRQVVLRTFPRIVREAAHEDFASDPDRETPCVYAPGEVLYMDSPVVIARLQELSKGAEEVVKPADESEKSPQIEEKPISPPLTPENEAVKLSASVPAQSESPAPRCATPRPVGGALPTGGSLPVRSATPVQKKVVCLSPPSSPNAKGHAVEA
ncbi:Uncharacterized protein PECH_006753 [Penicillium ucsense]|uniref:Uncharacterized protein n=1 Tax=Penicillium ucsense TaxID=2839758 RepID=A0A8J8WGX1_9EURO|nr:Uncharacterized protein PECM_000456 [Penicillium ucsense]KAF7735341.1 Uncharacterized protein PECH_006753 [Penicillium ucsense]